MPGKMKTPAPIDRPLSRAYLRGFTGWSTAYPPGQSEPTSLRVMENMFVDRNGALSIRPGLRYLSYKTAPDMDALQTQVPGVAFDLPIIGAQEPFYTNDGNKALLFACREADGTVSFRVILFSQDVAIVHTLTDPLVGFSIPQGEPAIRFPAATTHVEYLQIDNKIIALANVDEASEPIRLFFVGAEKVVRKIGNVSQPLWEDTHKLSVVHPNDTWIKDQVTHNRYNRLINPSFEAGGAFWARSPNSTWESPTNVGTTISGPTKGKLQSLPTRTNMATSPLHNVASTGTAGWHSSADYGEPKLSKDTTWLKVYDSKGKGTFLAYGAKMTYGVKAGQKYVVAVDFELGTHVDAVVWVSFYNVNGSLIGSRRKMTLPSKNGRFVSDGILAPTGTISMRISMGGTNEKTTSTFVKFKNLMVVKDGESTAMFSGSTAWTTGHEYYWVGDDNASASVDHPPVDISLTSNRSPVHAGAALTGSIYMWTAVLKNYTLHLRTYNKDAEKVQDLTVDGATNAGTAWVRASKGTATTTVAEVTADIQLVFKQVPRGHTVYVDAAMIEDGTATVGAYFDGSTPDTALVVNNWATTAHKSASVQTITTAVPIIPGPETPTAKTLIASGGAINNPYKIGFFYTFENEVGESAASKITEVRVSRPWSNWVWETANEFGEPSGTATPTAELCADQLVVWMPAGVFDQAVSEGALKWNLYAFAWSDQDPVPVVAQLIISRDLYADDTSSLLDARAIAHTDKGWIQVTPARRIGINDTVLPTRANRKNYSDAPQSRNGLVVGDRVILVDDLRERATIRWSSNRPGEYHNFTANRGGGAKTLTSGNLNVPVAVALWQNPQSVDTISILCQSADGVSTSYYMTPANVNAQSGSVAVMGFEETTSTPGTVAPYGVEVLNNALWRPTDRSLLKSTAQNYNISHKTVSDKIANGWWQLNAKQWIMSAQLDNRLYYLVHNRQGAMLEPNCKGNEIWVYDITGGEEGHWARLLIQGSALRVFSIGDREYLGITRPGGVFYLDPDAVRDDYVDTNQNILQRPIPWRFETTTQGANRAHDAWAHLQMIQITLGNFQGRMKYGIRGQDVHSQMIDMSKIVADLKPTPTDGSTWDIDDILQIRRDLKEWVLYGSSLDGEMSAGHLGYVQYRYTPTSVNVGYEYGSVETFDYGSNVAIGANIYADNGIPIPVMDYSRP